MKVFQLSLWCRILVWFLLAAFGIKLLSLVHIVERQTDYPRIRHANKLVSPGALPGAPPAPQEQSKRPEEPPQEPPKGPAKGPPKGPHEGPHEEPLEEPSTEALKLEQLLQSNEQHNWTHDGACAPYPRYKDLQIRNVHFQYSEGGNVSYYLYSAYYDRRLTMDRAPSIVLLGMISSFKGPFVPAYCQVWYEHSGRPELLEMGQQSLAWYEQWGNGPDYVYPMLFTCPLAADARRQRVPQLVSLVFEDRCVRATNALRVFYEAPQRQRAPRFAVCLKDLQFATTDMSERLVEWLELVRLLGAERVLAYDMGGDTLLPNTRRTLRHYAGGKDLLQLRPYKLLEGHPQPASDWELIRRLNEVLMYNDCLYRNLYAFDYLAVMDVDEVIMPLGQLHNWTALVERLEGTQPSADDNCAAHCSLCFRNVYYSRQLPPDETPPSSFYMLRHVQRVAEHLDGNLAIKCLHSTAFVRSLHNHFPLDWRQACGPLDVATSLGQMQHYREPDIAETLKEPPPVRDDNIWRFKEQLISNSLAIHRQLGWSLT